MKVMIFGPAKLTVRLRKHFENLGHEVSETTSNEQKVLGMVRESSAQLLLLDPNLSFQTSVAATHEGRDVYGKAVAFISPADEIVRDVLLDLHPVGILPSSPSRGDLASLVAAALEELEKASVKKPSSPSRDATSGENLRIIATVSMLLAISVGYFLPGGLPVLEGSGHVAYLIVVLLALVSIGCLLSVRRPILASLYAMAVALVTVLPTQQ